MIGELLEGKGVNMTPISQVNVTFKREGKGEVRIEAHKIRCYRDIQGVLTL